MKKITLAFMLLLSTVLFFSCNEKNEVGLPVIEKVTFYNHPQRDSSGNVIDVGDSIVTICYPDSMILIQGKNLATTRQVLFNGYPALLNATFITNEAIILRIPNKAPNLATAKDPTLVTNEMTVVTDYGKTSWTMKLLQSPPRVYSWGNENASSGTINELKGDAFYGINKIIYPGNVEVTSFEIDKDHASLKYTVPTYDRTKFGWAEIQATFGTAYFPVNSENVQNDTVRIFSNFDNINKFSNWPGLLVNNTSYTGNSTKFVSMFGTGFNDWFVTAAPDNGGGAVLNQGKCIDKTDLVTNVGDWAIRFELYLEKWKFDGNGVIQICIEKNGPGEGNSWGVNYKPGSTKDLGKWLTITLPVINLREELAFVWKQDLPLNLTDIVGTNGFKQITVRVNNVKAPYKAGIDNIRFINTNKESKRLKSIAIIP